MCWLRQTNSMGKAKEMIEPTDLDWLALCLVTESNLPSEWPFIAQVIENRRATGRWGHSYREVILAPMQFSAFNESRHLSFTVARFRRAATSQDTLLLMHAARYVGIAFPGPVDATVTVYRWVGSDGITPTTLHYYSPMSMKPAGSKPAWADSAKRLYTPEGVDPNRLVFAEAVA